MSEIVNSLVAMAQAFSHSSPPHRSKKLNKTRSDNVKYPQRKISDCGRFKTCSETNEIPNTDATPGTGYVSLSLSI